MELIDKSTLVAEIERRIAENKKDIERASHKNLEDYFEGYEDALVLFKHQFLDTVETKDVDFERELSYYVSNGIHRFFPNVDDDYCKMESFIWQDYVIETAKHFFELGLKAAQKGE